MFAKALDLHERGTAGAAMNAYRAALANEPSGLDAAACYSNLGMLLGASGRQAESVVASAAAALLSPRNPTVLYNLGNAHMELGGRDAEAAATYRRVLRLDRRHAPSYNNLALLSHRSGDAAAALTLFRAALACGSEQLARIGGAAQVYANIAAAGLGAPVAAEALAAQRAATALTPTRATSQLWLAERLLELKPVDAGRAAEAEAALMHAIRLAPADDHALNLLGTLLQSQPRRAREAAYYYRAAIAARPKHGDAYHNLGTVHQRLGQLEEARAMYAAALPLAPHVANVYISLASISPPPLNARYLRHAIDLQPKDPEGYLRLAAALAPVPLGGSAPTAEAHILDALPALRIAASLAPTDPRPHAAIGYAHASICPALSPKLSPPFPHLSARHHHTPPCSSIGLSGCRLHSPATSPATSPTTSPATSPANSPATSPANSPATSPATSSCHFSRHVSSTSPATSRATSPATTAAGYERPWQPHGLRRRVLHTRKLRGWLRPPRRLTRPRSSSERLVGRLLQQRHSLPPSSSRVGWRGEERR